MAERGSRFLLGWVVGLMTLLFVADLMIPLGAVIWLLYVGVILLSLWFSRHWKTYLTAAACSVLTAIGWCAAVPGISVGLAGLDRLIGIFAFWGTAILGVAARRTVEMSEANAKLREEICERERAEERLQEQASLLNLAHDAITVRDLNDTIVFWNKGAEKMYGWSSQEAVGKNARALIFRAGDTRFLEARSQMMRVGEWFGEFHQLTKDRRDIIAETRWTLVRNKEGTPCAILVVNTDVTEKKQLEAQLLRTQRLESIGVLAGGIAHDMNNLLTPILMAVKLLREPRPEEDRQKLLMTLQVGAERGAEMVKQLLAFAGGNDAQRSLVDVREIIQEVHSILEHTFSKSISVQTETAESLGQVMADATQLSQVLINLCVNARDAMPDGGLLTVSAQNVALDLDFVRTQPKAHVGTYVRMDVADAGTGIAPEVIDRIFDPFFTTKAQGKGTGLGLSTVLGIVHSHDGFLKVASQLGSGSRFEVYLPIAMAPEVTDPEPSVREILPGQQELILAVDDEALILSTVKATLENHGFRVLTAGNGREAVSIYLQHQHEIRAVLLDMMMPGMDGAATMAALRQIDARVRILASSGMGLKGRIAEAVAAAEGAFLQKPYTDEHLVAAVKKILRDG